MKHFRIKDENGDEFDVQEMNDDDVIQEEEETLNDDDSQLTAEEISALKGLAAVADKLMSLIQSTDSDEDKEEGFEDADEDEDIVEDGCEEEVVDTDEEEKANTKDSKASFGANEKRRTKSFDDSLTDSISDAWQKRYGGH